MIPKIIHQIWIGPKEPPIKPMDTWKDLNPDFEYIRWNEDEFIKRDMKFECHNRIDEIEHWCGKADIIRLELLYKYGGVFLDADSLCIETIDGLLYNNFMIYENEHIRKGLIANGIMGFIPKHPFIRKCIDFIINNEVSQVKTGFLPWQITGPVLVTKIYNENKYNDIQILPSYTFLPIHNTGLEYKGHGKVYSHQLWGSTFFYKIDMSGTIPKQFLPSDKTITLTIKNTDEKIYEIQNCINSIKNLIGNMNIKLNWINKSNGLNTNIIKNKLEIFKKSTRFIDVYYTEDDYIKDDYIKANTVFEPDYLINLINN